MPGKPTVASVEIGDAPPKGETRVRRAFCSPDRLVHRPTGDDGNINTMADVLQYAVRSEWATGGTCVHDDAARRVQQLTFALPTRPHLLAEYTNKPCMGYRDVIKTHTEKKEITKKVDGEEVKGECLVRAE
jgi:long-chain acyl-CoA synthetase